MLTNVTQVCIPPLWGEKPISLFTIIFLLILSICLVLNSSPIDELGEGAYESRWWCQAKWEP